jgi:hypothetical protein
MDDRPYTLALWKAKPGREQELIEAWNALSEVFLALPRPPVWGTLLQSIEDSTLFYSYGPWDALESIEAMRADAEASAAIGRLTNLCEEATPGAYRVAAEAGSH